MELAERAASILDAPEYEFVTTVIVINQAFSKLLAPHDLVPREWHVLCRLAARDGAPTQVELARSVFRDAPAISRLIDQLERKGLVERRRDPDDRRQHRIHLTRRGKRLCPKLFDAAEALQQAVIDELDGDELAGLRAAAAHLRGGYQRYVADELAPAGDREVG